MKIYKLSFKVYIPWLGDVPYDGYMHWEDYKRLSLIEMILLKARYDNHDIAILRRIGRGWKYVTSLKGTPFPHSEKELPEMDVNWFY